MLQTVVSVHACVILEDSVFNYIEHKVTNFNQYNIGRYKKRHIKFLNMVCPTPWKLMNFSEIKNIHIIVCVKKWHMVKFYDDNIFVFSNIIFADPVLLCLHTTTVTQAVFKSTSLVVYALIQVYLIFQHFFKITCSLLCAQPVFYWC